MSYSQFFSSPPPPRPTRNVAYFPYFRGTTSRAGMFIGYNSNINRTENLLCRFHLISSMDGISMENARVGEEMKADHIHSLSLCVLYSSWILRGVIALLLLDKLNFFFFGAILKCITFPFFIRLLKYTSNKKKLAAEMKKIVQQRPLFMYTGAGNIYI